MGWNEVSRIGVSGGTPGADGNTYVLFDSTKHLSGASLNEMDINRIQLALNNSQAGTLNASFSTDKGTTWTQYSSTAVAIYSTTTAPQPYDFSVDAYQDWKLEWVNGGVAQATWKPTVTAIVGYHGSLV